MTTRAERQRERIARLPEQATYACSVEDGRGVRSVHADRQREAAERRFRDAAAKLAAAATPPADPGRSQGRLPLA